MRTAFVTTDCNRDLLLFHSLNQREVRGEFEGGSITSDGGSVGLREVEKRTGIIAQFAASTSQPLSFPAHISPVDGSVQVGCWAPAVSVIYHWWSALSLISP
jgi:hypothetical protein